MVPRGSYHPFSRCHSDPTDCITYYVHEPLTNQVIGLRYPLVSSVLYMHCNEHVISSMPGVASTTEQKVSAYCQWHLYAVDGVVDTTTAAIVSRVDYLP